MTFSYKIKVDKCVGSCNDVENAYFKVCLPDVIKNISVKSLVFITVVNVVVYEMEKFVTINKNGIKINADVNV